MSKDVNTGREFCDSCHIGSWHPCRATYAHWHDGQFIIVPEVPAWRCDFCGDTYYEREAISRLVLLLGPEPDSAQGRRWRATGLEESGGEALGDHWRVC
jgi:YgiT-type zinc finger domain-containing protein